MEKNFDTMDLLPTYKICKITLHTYVLTYLLTYLPKYILILLLQNVIAVIFSELTTVKNGIQVT